MAASIGHEQRPAYYDELSDELILAAAAVVNAKRKQMASAPTTSPATDQRFMRNVDLGGEDYLTMELPKDDPLLCQAACRSDDRCASWTHVAPNVQGPQARCWLKNRDSQASIQHMLHIGNRAYAIRGALAAA